MYMYTNNDHALYTWGESLDRSISKGEMAIGYALSPVAIHLWILPVHIFANNDNV